MRGDLFRNDKRYDEELAYYEGEMAKHPELAVTGRVRERRYMFC